MTRRTALVTGSAGFVGRHTVAELERRGYHVTGIDIANDPPADARTLFRNVIEDRLAGWRPDLVVHAAAVVGGRTMIDGRPLELAAVDLELDALMFRWVQIARPGRVVYLSSSAAYPTVYQSHAIARRLDEWLIDHRASYLGSPDNTYGLVKLVGERLALEAQAEGIPVTVVRPFSGYGLDQALDYPFPSFIDRARRRLDPFPVWGDGEQVRDFIHIDDVVAGFLDAAEAGIDVPVTLGTGRPVSFNELAELVSAAAGYRPALEHHLDAPVGVEYRVADPTRYLELGLGPCRPLEAVIADAFR